MHPTAKKIIDKLQLLPHPEGGYYKEIYRSPEKIITERKISRSASTSIYYLLRSEDFSAWHRLTSDEVWHFYHGSLLTIYVLDRNGELITHKLGDPLITPEANFQAIIPANQWFAAQPDEADSYSLIGCTVAPGFEFVDFELAKESELFEQYPAHKNIIKKFIRT